MKGLGQKDEIAYAKTELSENKGEVDDSTDGWSAYDARYVAVGDVLVVGKLRFGLFEILLVGFGMVWLILFWKLVDGESGVVGEGGSGGGGRERKRRIILDLDEEQTAVLCDEGDEDEGNCTSQQTCV